MRVLFDMGHPAHVHFFKNTIWELQKHGHQVQVTARDKDVTIALLKAYDIPYELRGTGGASSFKKGLGLIKTDLKMLKIAGKFKPDVMCGILNPYTAQVSRLVGAKSITFTDTEHAKAAQKMTFPFTDLIVTPQAYLLDHGKKHVRYNGFHELAYLHPNRFTPDPNIIEELGMKSNDKYVIIRFVSWEASHDIGYTGISNENKVKLVNFIKKWAIPIITSEGTIPKELQEYQMKIPPHKIHNALSYANLYVGEGATMASESAMLGIPSIYVNTLNAGTLKKQEEYGLIKNLREFEGVIQEIESILGNNNIRDDFRNKRDIMLQSNTDVTEFIKKTIQNAMK